MIYCVEDDANVRDIEVYALRSTGFEAEGVEGGAELFAALKKYFGENKFALAKSENLIAAFDSLYDVEGMIAGFVEGKTVI